MRAVVHGRCGPVRSRSLMIFFIQTKPMPIETIGGDEQDVCPRVGEQHPDVLGVQHVHDDAETGGQQRRARWRSSRPSAVSVATSRRRRSRWIMVSATVMQQLGEVAADLTLDADGHDGPGEVRAVHAVGRRRRATPRADGRAGTR